MDKQRDKSKSKKYDISWSSLLLGIVLFGAGAFMAVLSSSYSFTGFEATWPEIPNVGWIGILIAVLAYVAFFAPPILQKNIAGWKGYVAATLCIIAGGFLAYGDGFGNEQALRADVRGETAEFQKLSGEYTTAQKDLPILQQEAASIKDAREAIQTAFIPVATDTEEQKMEKIKRAQVILLDAGKYEGRIDGKPERKTEDAARAYGPVLQARLDELQRKIDAANVILSRGEPMPVNTKKSEVATMIGYGVTLAGIFCSLLSSLLLQTGIRPYKTPEDQAPEYMSDEYLARQAKNFERGLKLVSQKAAQDVLAARGR